MQETYQKIIFQKEADQEIKRAEAEGRDADFSNQTIQELNFSEKEIRCGLNFKNTVFLGSLYLGKSSIIGDLTLEGAVINNTLYIGEIKITGGLIASRMAVKNSFNAVGSNVGGLVNIEKAHIQGFLSLNKANIIGNVNAKSLQILSMETDSGVIKGDLNMQAAKIQGSLDMEMGYISGLADFQKINIWGFFNLSNCKIVEVLIMRESYIKGESLFEGLECEERIVSF